MVSHPGASPTGKAIPNGKAISNGWPFRIESWHSNHDKLCNLDVLKAWDYAQTNFIAKSFRLHILIFRRPGSRPAGGLLGRQNCILSQKSIPQGLLGRIKLYFELESRPAGAFWAKYFTSCESKVACIFLKKSARVLWITFWYCRRIDLDKRILLVNLLLKKVFSASSYGHFTAAK